VRNGTLSWLNFDLPSPEAQIRGELPDDGGIAESSGCSSANCSTSSIFSTRWDFHYRKNFGGDIGHVPLILLGNNYRSDADAVSSNQFFLQAANREHFSRSVTSPVMAMSHRAGMRVRALISAVAIVIQRKDRLSDRAFGNVHMNINVAVEILSLAENRGARTEHTPCRPERIPALRRQVFL